MADATTSSAGGPCCATTAAGRPCRNKASRPDGMCGVHSGDAGDASRGCECPVCLLTMRRRSTATMACGHRFHTKCLRAWFRGRALSCPLCRGVCVEGLALLGPRLAPRLQALVRTVPPPHRAFFPSYIIAQLETPGVATSLGVDKDQVELLIDLACECFTKDNFFAKIKAMAL